MDIKFEGDIAVLTPATEELCRKTLQEKGFSKCTVKVEPVGKTGDNYVANVKRFIAQEDGVNDGKPFKMVAKIAPTIEQLRLMTNTAIAFNNEIVVYTELIPKYVELQSAANIPKDELLRYPLCYATQSNPPNETIILEDLNEAGFAMLSRFTSLNDEQAKLALKELSKYHSLSFVLRAKDPEYFDRIKNKLINIWVLAQGSEEMKQFVAVSEQETLGLLKNEDYKKRIKGIVVNVMKSAVAMHTADINSRHSAIIQGDSWTNNMMFYMKDDKAVDIIMLDHQIARAASPASEILYFILNCTDYETRKKHFYDWIDYYYKSLEDSLSNFGMKANYYYPRDKLDADLQRYGKYSLGISCMLSNMLVREPEDVVDFKQDPTIEMNVDIFSVKTMRDEIVERLNTRLEGLIQSCIDFGFI